MKMMSAQSFSREYMFLPIGERINGIIGETDSVQCEEKVLWVLRRR